MSKCKSCGAHIRWAKTPIGRNMPIDFKPVADYGNIELTEQLNLGGEAELLAMVVKPGNGTHVSHFKTCPFAKQHRQ